MVKIKGRFPALVKIFYYSLKETLILTMPEGGKITIHMDGTIVKSKSFAADIKRLK